MKLGTPAGRGKSMGRRYVARALCAIAVAAMATAVGACYRPPDVQPTKPVPRFAELPNAELPDVLRETVADKAVFGETEPVLASAFGLVAQLRNTGDTTSPTTVREHILKQMARNWRPFGESRSTSTGTPYLPPEAALKLKSFAIVTVEALIPPGARKGQYVDAFVTALPESTTTSLAGGSLWQVELKEDGANAQAPARAPVVIARSGGPLFINPAVALNPDPNSPAARASLRSAIILNGADVSGDRNITVRLRQPQRPVALAIARVINQRFQGTDVARAKNEAEIFLYVPESFRGDWEHFVGVVRNLYVTENPAFLAERARVLAQLLAANTDPGRIEDYSYAMEGLGPTLALPLLGPLINHSDPTVSYQAARAAAFLGDMAARQRLMLIAQKVNHPESLAAVRTLGQLPDSPLVNDLLRRLLDADQATVRIEAYKILARNGDARIITEKISGRFLLDIVPSQGPPLVYASRSGVPRIAIIGTDVSVSTPVTFTALNLQFSLSSDARGMLKLFYRGPEVRAPVQCVSGTGLAEVVARLGGRSEEDGVEPFPFGYSDVVAMVQGLADRQYLVSQQAPGSRQAIASATFVLQSPPDEREKLAALGTGARPQNDGDAPTGFLSTFAPPRRRSERTLGADGVIPQVPAVSATLPSAARASEALPGPRPAN